MDSGWVNRIGLLLGILALVLTVPLAVVANLLTPYVHDWWSGRTEAQRKTRIVELERRLTEAENGWLFTEAERELRWMLQGVHLAVASFVHMLFGLILIVAALFRNTIQPSLGNVANFFAFGTLVGAGIVINFYILQRASSRWKESWYLHTDTGRAKLCEEISKLKGKLKNNLTQLT